VHPCVLLIHSPQKYSKLGNQNDINTSEVFLKPELEMRHPYQL